MSTRWSEADLAAARQQIAPTGKRSKYGNRKTTVDGITFDSKREAARWQELNLLVKAGKISGLTRQMPYTLVVNGVSICKYIADFVYEEPAITGKTVIEDVKGYRTREFIIKAKLMKAIHQIDIREVQ